jgi:mono/diheme cytochrome c family protein
VSWRHTLVQPGAGLLLLLGVGGALGAAHAQPQPPAGASPGSEGRDTFAAYCSFCHELRPVPSPTGVSRGLTLEGGSVPLKPQEIMQLLADPPVGMPLIELTEAQLAALVDFLDGGGPHVIRTDTNHP